jgi:hypothetical protein
MTQAGTSDDPGVASATGPAADQQKQNPLLHHLVPGRECGPCNVCCKVMQIREPDFEKPGYVYCKHCTAAGCAIHATRPEVCRAWFCLWRRIAVMPEEVRPDKLGIIFSIETYNPPRTPFERIYIIGRAVDDPAAFETPYGQAAINMFVREGSYPVFLGFQGQKRLVDPDAQLADAILDPENTAYRDRVPAALEFRRKYGMT